MPKKNLAKIWKKFGSLTRQLNIKKITKEKLYENVDSILADKEVQTIINDLGLILLSNHEDLLDNVSLSFTYPLEGDFCSSFDNRQKIIFIDPIKTIQFWQYSKKINLTDEEHQLTKELFCKATFLKQLSKLPDKLFLFLVILKQLAVSANLNQVNYTGGYLVQDDISFYQTMLWAFNTLEKKIEELHGINIRTKYSIIWHQSEWLGTSK